MKPKGSVPTRSCQSDPWHLAMNEWMGKTTAQNSGWCQSKVLAISIYLISGQEQKLYSWNLNQIQWKQWPYLLYTLAENPASTWWNSSQIPNDSIV